MALKMIQKSLKGKNPPAISRSLVERWQPSPCRRRPTYLGVAWAP